MKLGSWSWQEICYYIPTKFCNKFWMWMAQLAEDVVAQLAKATG
jgi:hypothetical protein